MRERENAIVGTRAMHRSAQQASSQDISLCISARLKGLTNLATEPENQKAKCISNVTSDKHNNTTVYKRASLMNKTKAMGQWRLVHYRLHFLRHRNRKQPYIIVLMTPHAPPPPTSSTWINPLWSLRKALQLINTHTNICTCNLWLI